MISKGVEIELPRLAVKVNPISEVRLENAFTLVICSSFELWTVHVIYLDTLTSYSPRSTMQSETGATNFTTTLELSSKMGFTILNLKLNSVAWLLFLGKVW